MLNSGYFTSRHELMEWASRVAAVNLTRIEQLGSGNVYCQILDAAYPEKVPLNKVKWQAYLEVEFLHNFKVFQSCLQRLGISKDIDVSLFLCRPNGCPTPTPTPVRVRGADEL